jgi:hypothetical protein
MLCGVAVESEGVVDYNSSEDAECNWTFQFEELDD